MVEQIARVLRPGGRPVVAHEFRSFEPVPPWSDPSTADEVLDRATETWLGWLGSFDIWACHPGRGRWGDRVRPQGADAGHHLQTHGFDIETADHPEPFTFPLALSEEDEKEIVDLGNRVMKLKARCLVDPEESLTIGRRACAGCSPS